MYILNTVWEPLKGLSDSTETPPPLDNWLLMLTYATLENALPNPRLAGKEKVEDIMCVTVLRGLRYRCGQTRRVLYSAGDSQQCSSDSQPDGSRAFWRYYCVLQCSEGCGTGVQTRRVFCSAGDSRQCSSDSQPDSSRACSSDKSCGNQWFTGSWGQVRSTQILIELILTILFLGKKGFCYLYFLFFCLSTILLYLQHF